MRADAVVGCAGSGSASGVEASPSRTSDPVAGAEPVGGGADLAGRLSRLVTSLVLPTSLTWLPTLCRYFFPDDGCAVLTARYIPADCVSSCTQLAKPQLIPSEPEESFLTVAEVASILKLNQQTVRNWIDQGSLPALRVGRRVQMKRSDFERVLASYTAGSGSPAQDAGPSAEDFWGGEPVSVITAPNTVARTPLGDGVSFKDDLDRQRAQIMRAVRQAGTN